MAQWIVSVVVPVESFVPEEYIKWRPPVRDAMMFVVAHLSPSRLAPKLLEQIELPPRTTAEVRLLRLIAKVPGLQKLGQVIARNQHLRPGLRKALERLENGIRDVKPDDIRAIVHQNLGVKLTTFAVKIAPTILKEASVSAVVRFTWRNPDTGRRERGVFKVLSLISPSILPKTSTTCRGSPNTSQPGIISTDFRRDSYPTLFGKSAACCGMRSISLANRRLCWKRRRSIARFGCPRPPDHPSPQHPDDYSNDRGAWS